MVLGSVYNSTGEVFASYRRIGYQGEAPSIKLHENHHNLPSHLITVFKEVVLDKEKLGTLCI